MCAKILDIEGPLLPALPHALHVHVSPFAPLSPGQCLGHLGCLVGVAGLSFLSTSQSLGSNGNLIFNCHLFVTIHIGRSLQYFFISFFATEIDFASLIAKGALFHSLTASLVKLSCAILDLPPSSIVHSIEGFFA